MIWSNAMELPVLPRCVAVAVSLEYNHVRCPDVEYCSFAWLEGGWTVSVPRNFPLTAANSPGQHLPAPYIQWLHSKLYYLRHSLCYSMDLHVVDIERAFKRLDMTPTADPRGCFSSPFIELDGQDPRWNLLTCTQ